MNHGSTRQPSGCTIAGTRPRPRRIALAEVLLAAPSNLLLLARGTTLAPLLLCALVALRDLLFERGERRVRGRSSRPGLVSLVRHFETHSSALPTKTRPLDVCESETPGGGDGLFTVALHGPGQQSACARTRIQGSPTRARRAACTREQALLACGATFPVASAAEHCQPRPATAQVRHTIRVLGAQRPLRLGDLPIGDSPAKGVGHS